MLLRESKQGSLRRPTSVPCHTAPPPYTTMFYELTWNVSAAPTLAPVTPWNILTATELIWKRQPRTFQEAFKDISVFFPYSSSSFLSFHQESYVRQIVPSQCLAQPMAMPLAVARSWGEQAVSIMGQTSRCCMVCLMPQSHVSCSLENPHFNIDNRYDAFPYCRDTTQYLIKKIIF